MASFKFYFVGYQDSAVNVGSIDRALRKLKSFEYIGHEIIEIFEVPNGIFTDEMAFSRVNVSGHASISIIFVKFPLEENFFTRTNLMYDDGHKFRNGPTIYIQTSFDLIDLSKLVPISATSSIVGSTLVDLITASFLLRDGQYDDLFTDTVEKSSFNFCANKFDIVESFKNCCLGDRAKLALMRNQFTQSEIDAIESDFKRLKPGLRSTAHGWAKSNPEIFAIISGAFIAAIFFMLGLSF